MWHYESRTSKPTVLWSSSRAITKFWLGKLKRAEVRAQAEIRNPCRRGPPVKRWIDKEGRKRFKGTNELTATGSRPEIANRSLNGTCFHSDHYLAALEG